MQYNVPQFVDVEDKIFGPLTLKQFLVMLAGGLLIFLYWSIFNGGVVFFALALPTALVAVAIALGRFNGQPILSTFPALLQFFLRPRYRIFKRTGGEPQTLIRKQDKPAEQKELTPEELEPSSSRLSKLAYILDQKSTEERELIHGSESGEGNTNIRIHANDTKTY